MGWQDYVVIAIGVVVVVVIARRLVCLFSGKRKGGCAGCDANCPMRREKKR